MTGWKTWTAAALSVLYGVGGLIFGFHNIDIAMGFVVSGLALIGIGHKIEKSGQ